MQAEHRAGVRERRGDVVAVADEGERTALERSEMLLQREHVGQRLAGMLLVRQRVDDVQLRRGLGEAREPLLRERADDGAVHPALEIAGDVLDGLAAAERRLRPAAR